MEKGRKLSTLESLLSFQLSALQLVEPEKEFRFHPVRKWRFDFAWPDKKLAAEVEGGTWKGGRHTRGSGFEKDCEKYNTATVMGWRVLRFTSTQVRNGTALETIKTALEA